MPVDWQPLVELIRSHQSFLLTTHVRPDGDGLGSVLALAETLRSTGKDVHCVILSDLPPRYRFIDPDKRLLRFHSPGLQLRDADVIMVLDTGTFGQLGDFGQFLRNSKARKVVVDHHLTQDDLGAVRFVDTGAEATGRLVFEIINALRLPLSATAAQLLLIAVAMDTGWFRHSNTTAQTFALAEQLVKAGARPEIAYEQLFEQSTLARLKLTGLILDRLTLTGGNRVAYTEVRRADYAATGAQPQDTEDMINYTRAIGGVEVGLIFMEQPVGGVKVSFRSRSLDVARVAEKFGGGGHRLASGATLRTSLDEARTQVLDAVLSELASSASVLNRGFEDSAPATRGA